MANLKAMIDRNFGGIDGAIGLSTAEAASAAVAAGETSSNVQAIATSAEELAASIGEISQSMLKSRSTTENAFEQIISVGKNTENLAIATQAMQGIVGLIRSVASQINLLTLNATIESARAGQAGKGFAVVASEVKNLAVQASRATEQISSEIEGIQATSRDLAGGLGVIGDAVTTVRDSISTRQHRRDRLGRGRTKRGSTRDVDQHAKRLVCCLNHFGEHHRNLFRGPASGASHGRQKRPRLCCHGSMAFEPKAS